jgi:hypothetical protein
MKRSYLLLSWCALVACAGQEAGSANANPVQSRASKSTPHRSRLVPARYFADPANRQAGVQAVREHTEREVTLAGHYSQSIVSCGIGCLSFWIVDRRTGAIMDLPPGPADAEFVYEVRGRRESDIIHVIFGSSPTHDAPAHCWARSYRLRGTRFTALGGFSRARCP